jgi:hypothetical protein
MGEELQAGWAVDQRLLLMRCLAGQRRRHAAMAVPAVRLSLGSASRP